MRVFQGFSPISNITQCAGIGLFRWRLLHGPCKRLSCTTKGFGDNPQFFR
jgi:hypothetical protein